MPYFTGPNSADSVPKQASETNSSGSDGSRKPAAAIATAPNSTSLRRRAIKALS